MKCAFRDKINYKLERFLSKGGFSIVISLIIIFISGFLFIATIRFFLINVFSQYGYPNNFWEDVWITFLQLTDPGSMGLDDASPGWLKFTAILAGVAGIILLSVLIAFITTSFEKILYDFRKGRGKFIENGHILILGWNERVVDIIRELIIANESEKKASIVVLSEENKENMDDLLTKRLPDTKTTQIVTTNGDFANINELIRVNVKNAKSVIVLANCSERACLNNKINSDIQSIKSIFAIIAAQKGKNHLPIIVEIYTKEKHDIINYLNEDNIVAINSWDIMGKLLAQTSLNSGLEIVYNEILSFEGSEIYFYHDHWNNINFYESVYHFEDGIPLGIYNESLGIKLRPPGDTKLKDEDKLIILAEDDSTVTFSHTPIYHYLEKRQIKKIKLKREKKKILILGWHSIANVFISELNDYLIEGCVFDIMFNSPSAELEANINHLKNQFPQFNINLINANPLKLEHLENKNPNEYHNIIILSQSLDEQSPDKIDSDTIIILLMLRGITKNFENTNIITQVLNSENQEIITQTDVDDFIISNKLITMILAQLSEAPLIKLFYEDIFSEEGSEIYVKPTILYFDSFPQRLKFIEIVNIVNMRNEICLGLRNGNQRKNKETNFGVILNPPKDEVFEININDFFVVLSENEL